MPSGMSDTKVTPVFADAALTLVQPVPKKRFEEASAKDMTYLYLRQNQENKEGWTSFNATETSDLNEIRSGPDAAH